MAQAEAFLSYTHIDDEYFGGNITSLRKLLELGVKVVTGNLKFAIFQDVDGIALGQDWQKRLEGAISSTNLLIPILTPCFLESLACRNELEKFLEREKTLARDDLILPIYFVTIPSLEKLDLRAKDPLAAVLCKRQYYDWRERAELPMVDLSVRKAVKELSEKIAQAIQRTGEIAVEYRHTAIVEPLRDPDVERQFEEASRRVASEESLAPARSKKAVLWVDDRPDNNLYEREALKRYGVNFTLVTSTDEAVKILSTNKFDAIISDMGRPPDPRAGYTLLGVIRARGQKTPYFIYAGSRAAEHVAEANRRGAQGTTNRADELVGMVLGALGVS